MSGTDCVVCGARTDLMLCADCTTILERAIGDLPGLVRDLVTRATRHDRVFRANPQRLGPDEELAGLEEEYAWRTAAVPSVMRSRDGRITLPAADSPADLDALRLLTVARNTIGTWARHIAETRGLMLTAPDPRIGWTACVCGWLLRNLDAIRLDEAASEIHDDLTELRDRLERAIDRSPPLLFAGPCPECEAMLYRPTATDGVACRCGASYTAAERTDWLLDELEDSLVTLDALRSFLRPLGWVWPPATTVGSWRLRGRLQVKAPDHHGVELFRGGDVLALLAEWEAKVKAS